MSINFCFAFTGINKPNKQTILTLQSIPKFFSTLPISKVNRLGGKFGTEVCEKFNIKFMGDLTFIKQEELTKAYGEKNGNWLYLISKGIDLECVTPKFTNKSIGCCKRFPGKISICIFSNF